MRFFVVIVALSDVHMLTFSSLFFDWCHGAYREPSIGCIFALRVQRTNESRVRVDSTVSTRTVGAVN